MSGLQRVGRWVSDHIIMTIAILVLVAGRSTMRTRDPSGLPVSASQSMMRPYPPDAMVLPSAE